MQKQWMKMDILELLPYENNPRKNDGAVDAVMESIKQTGYITPIVIDETGTVLAGHTRLKALKKMGHTGELDVLMVSGMTDEEKRKYRILDNKTGEFAEWDMEALEKELEGLDFGDFDFDFGIEDGTEEGDGEVKEDEYDKEPPAEPNAKRGDLYRLGRHYLMCGDSTMIDDVEKLVQGQKMDLLITDPPYNVDYGKVRDLAEAQMRHMRTDGLVIMNDKMDDEKFRQFLRDAFATADTVLKPGAVFYIWHADGEGYNFRGACRDVGWQVRQTIIWNKNTFAMGRQDYQWKHEPCLYGWKDGAGHLWASDRKQTTVIDMPKPSKSELHPTMKPIALFDYQIKNNTKGGDAVLDLFGGSGTTIMACEQNGRNAYSMELDPRYVDVIIDRWETFTGMKAELVEG